MHWAIASILILVALPIASSQGQLVIVTERTKEYHRPSCPIIRDGKQKDIIAMTLGQAELRGFKAHAACHSADARDSAQATGGTGSVEERQRPIVVYTAADDKRYHRETCAKLGKERRKLSLEEAGKKLWPCPVCRPPIRKRTPAIPRR